MEILLLALLLTMSGSDPEHWKRSLASALNFYRENRELLAMLAQTASAGGRPASAAPTAETQEKRQSPAEETAEQPIASILEEFLKNHPI